MAKKYNAQGLLENAKSNMDVIENALAKKLNTEVSSKRYDEQINSTETISGFDKFKQATITSGTLKIPTEVYKKFADSIYDSLSGSVIKKYSTNEKKMVQQIINSLNKGLGKIPNTSVKVQNITYTIEFLFTANNSGMGVSAAKVTSGKKSSYLVWTSMSKRALAEYCAALYQLGNDVIKSTWKDLVKGCVKDAVKVVQALYGVDSKNKLLKEVFGNSILKSATKAQLKSGFNEILNSTTQGRKVVSASSQYEKLVGLYASLENAAKKGKNIDNISSSFVTACNKLEKSLGLETSTLSDGTQLIYNKSKTMVTVPKYYGNTLKANAYKSTVKIIEASGRTNAINIAGNANDNAIYGGSGKNTISGGSGNDIIQGNKSNDLLKGDAGADVILGGAGKDTLYGGDEKDELYGDIGNDTLYGGKGNDSNFAVVKLSNYSTCTIS